MSTSGPCVKVHRIYWRRDRVLHCMQLWIFIVDQYFPVIEDLEIQLEKIEDKISKEKPSRETTEQIYQLKRDLLEVRRAVSPLIDICNRLMRFEYEIHL